MNKIISFLREKNRCKRLILGLFVGLFTLYPWTAKWYFIASIISFRIYRIYCIYCIYCICNIYNHYNHYNHYPCYPCYPSFPCYRRAFQADAFPFLIEADAFPFLSG